MMIMCASTSHTNEPVTPIIAKKRRNAMPSTRPGITSGDRNRPLRKLRPGKSARPIARPAGNAITSDSVADANASFTLLKNAAMKSG